MKRMILVLTGAVIMLSPVLAGVSLAQDEGAAKGKIEKKVEKQRQAPTDMTVTGVITKNERQGKEGKTIVQYILTDKDGNKVMLGGRHGDQAAAPAVNLADYVGKNVTVVGKGYTRQHDGKQMTHLVEITKVDVAVPAAAASPAAPAAPTAK